MQSRLRIKRIWLISSLLDIQRWISFGCYAAARIIHSIYWPIKVSRLIAAIIYRWPSAKTVKIIVLNCRSKAWCVILLVELYTLIQTSEVNLQFLIHVKYFQLLVKYGKCRDEIKFFKFLWKRRRERKFSEKYRITIVFISKIQNVSSGNWIFQQLTLKRIVRN